VSAGYFKEHARGALLLGWLGTGCSLFGGVHVDNVATGAQRPANVAMYVAVSDADEPVTDLEPKNFQIYENEEPLNADEVQRQLVPREVVTEERVLLLLDLSGSPDADTRAVYARSVEAFVRKLASSVSVSVRAFDGGNTLKPAGEFARGTAKPNAGSLQKLSSADSSRNLNGAVKLAVAELDRSLKFGNKPVRLGTLVVFARGADLAGRVSESELDSVLSTTKHDVIGVGIGEDTSYLDFARGGVIQAQAADTLPIAFEEAGSRAAKLHGKYYLVTYCSPARSGRRSVRLVVEYTNERGDEKSGSSSYEFDAKGFGPGCRSSALPRFDPPPRPPGSDAGGDAAPALVNQAPASSGDGVVPPPSSSDYEK
jgi:hypothetical protein